eukprot:CAMPEP_0184992272 /NCGR_PEP_ID=MMETSP1098-20130426/40581_1 /TAXON_ID=89044 /ORGANISM="Spumella elongata, Strain CCAP 955/1" /LENGTH=66 /DNA_ID=CAMNT_0027517849 /DNA_START=28 /DNA_END=224 /DNA_ORIENTATION=-
MASNTATLTVIFSSTIPAARGGTGGKLGSSESSVASMDSVSVAVLADFSESFCLGFGDRGVSASLP